eukprot:scaffold32625_cov112-Isochrysis_galbana.AAC.4
MQGGRAQAGGAGRPPGPGACGKAPAKVLTGQSGEGAAGWRGSGTGEQQQWRGHCREIPGQGDPGACSPEGLLRPAALGCATAHASRLPGRRRRRPRHPRGFRSRWWRR